MTPSIATAADYADAMLVARRAKNWLFGLLLLILLLQLGLFFTARYAHVLPMDQATPTASAQPASATTFLHDRRAPQLLQYLIGLTDFMGIALALVLASVIYLLLKIMLVGRLIGVSYVTSAYIWCLVLAVLLFPWQAFLNNQNFTGDMRIPGVLYTWNELVQFARFPNDNIQNAILKWARFVAFPLASVIILLTVQTGSSKGLRKALGEEVDTSTAADTLNVSPPHDSPTL
jgi:hypothetical protein